MPDMSELDRRYFIDFHVFNCPFCNRRNVSYHVVSRQEFSWTPAKICQVYLVRCESCRHVSLHLSFTKMSLLSRGYDERFQEQKYYFSPTETSAEEDADAVIDLDGLFFYSVPTSFFVLDDRIPKILRELMTEAEGCLKSNFLTGASACARKVVYELSLLHEAAGDSYESRIKFLKTKLPHVDGTFFDTLLTIQQVTSDKVHENAHDGWQATHLRIILSALAEVLTEIYVIPAVRLDRRKAVLALKEAVLRTDTSAAPTSAPAPKGVGGQ